MKKVLTTLIIPHLEGRVLLGMKKRGFGEGFYNGFGGKLEKGETIEENMQRELKEEVNIVATDFKMLGVLEFTFENSDELIVTYIYKVYKYSGKIKESEEMLPKWFEINEIPFEKMWPDDKYWYDLFLGDEKFKGKFHFSKDKEILTHVLEIIENFE